MFFKDYCETGLIYHVAPVTGLKKIMDEGLISRECRDSGYYEFNNFFDRYKPQRIPEWVKRGKAIYGSMNFKEDNKWHSHSAILAVKVDKERCWVGNENLANILYEPFILADMETFHGAKKLIRSRGEEFVSNYWQNSISFKDYLKLRIDKNPGYDAEVLIMHDISPGDIKIVKLISDHRFMDIAECNTTFYDLCNAIIHENH